MLSGMRRRAVRALDRVERWLEPEAATMSDAEPVWNAPTRAEAATAPEPVLVPEPVVPEPVVPEPVVAAPAPQVPQQAAPATLPEPVVAAEAPADDVVGAPILLDKLEQVLDDLVRPALQSDGGDITVVKIESNDIYVRLVGACSTCPSSIMTLRMGVERLLREEFPEMRELIQVDDLI